MQRVKKKNIWTWPKEMSRTYRCVKFVNISLSSGLGGFLRRMLHVLRHDEWHWHWQKEATLYNKKKRDINIAI